MDVHPPATGHLGLLLFQDTTAPKNIGLGGFCMDKSLTFAAVSWCGTTEHPCMLHGSKAARSALQALAGERAQAQETHQH